MHKYQQLRKYVHTGYQIAREIFIVIIVLYYLFFLICYLWLFEFKLNLLYQCLISIIKEINFYLKPRLHFLK